MNTGSVLGLVGSLVTCLAVSFLKAVHLGVCSPFSLCFLAWEQSSPPLPFEMGSYRSSFIYSGNIQLLYNTLCHIFLELGIHTQGNMSKAVLALPSPSAVKCRLQHLSRACNTRRAQELYGRPQSEYSFRPDSGKKMSWGRSLKRGRESTWVVQKLG